MYTTNECCVLAYEVVASKTTISFSYLPPSLLCVIKKINIALYEVIYETVYVYQSTCPECALDQTITGSIQSVHILF
jgi:hypothetical protein